MLWLALWLPDLPLAAFAARPLGTVVVARGQIVACDELAHAAGIVPGLRSATARGLLPELVALARDPAREAALLEELACWAGRYTPALSLVPPAALLLDIGASLELFGGAQHILDGIARGCDARGLKARLAAAPTPRAALWLARGADAAGTVVERSGAPLVAALARLPIAVIEPEPDVAERLAGFGVRSLGDLLALPRAGLARRIGVDLREDIERALGECPDPRPHYVFPARFALRIELPARVDAAPALAFAAQRLIEALCGWLAPRQAGIATCTLVLEHGLSARRPACSSLALRCASPTRAPERLLRLLRERLERTRLAAPVEALRLEADACETLPGRCTDLFDAAETAGVDLLIERLRARLGDDAVQGLAVHPDHRPECATRAVAPGSASPAIPQPAPARPLWLLAAPEALPEIGGRPHRRGQPLELLAGPERIASGWWDGGERRHDAWTQNGAATGDVRRDYFIARTARHGCYWIYRDAAGWFLHGVFA